MVRIEFPMEAEMQVHEARGGSHRVGMRARKPYRRRLYAVAAVPPVVAILVIVFAPDPHGHWSEHLWSAYFDGAQLVLLVVLAAMLGRRALSVPLLIALLVIAVGIVFEAIGNYQVAESIWGRSGNPGFGHGYIEGHDRAATGDLLVVCGGAAFAVIAGVRRHVRYSVALLALVMVIIPPPFLWPAAGVLMLLLHGLTSETAFSRRQPGVDS